MYTFTFDSMNLEIRTIAEGIFRIRLSATDEYQESLLERYGILQEPEVDYPGTLYEDSDPMVSAGNFSVQIDKREKTLLFAGQKTPLKVLLPTLSPKKQGFSFEILLDDKERLYGTGDVSRKELNKRGTKCTIWQTNVTSYGPIPYVMSSRGWGVLVNCTYQQEFDMGASKTDRVRITAIKGGLDFYVFLADAMVDTLELYTRISGRPVVLPRAAYGVTNVCNEDYDASRMVTDCMRYRKYDIPCDVMGLEPSWMEKHYDYSVEKKWNSERFIIPRWAKTGPYTFFYPLRKMGYKLSLWLCCDYDLLWEEEKNSLEIKQNSFDGATIVDHHFNQSVIMDKLTKQGEPWFEHLKKFVDQGVFGFKLDGANQVLDHPDRLWAGKYTDDEVHNIYPVIYAKQMKEGFENHTGGRRAMINTSSSFVGTQKYAATWAGDTGGGLDTLISVLNFALCGHTNTSCDLEFSTPFGMHYGFLMSWTQFCGWRSWGLPWFAGEETESMWRRYAKLRSSLFPYIYSMAHKAAQIGLPIVRPMCLMYPDHEEFGNVANMYMLGDSLLVAAFDMNIRLPKGLWRDLFTGDIYEGGKEFTYQIPEGWGGALLAKEGSIWITQEPKPYLDSPVESALTIHVYPGEDCEFTMMQDDGITYGYVRGEVAKTHMYLRRLAENCFEFVLEQRKGGYTVNESTVYDVNKMNENSSANIHPLPEASGFQVVVYLEACPKAVLLKGSQIETQYADGKLSFYIEKELHKVEDCKVQIQM